MSAPAFCFVFFFAMATPSPLSLSLFLFLSLSLLSLLSAQEGINGWKKEGEWLSDYDKLAIVRIMKTASTTLIQEGFPSVNCMPHVCECPSGELIREPCLFQIRSQKNNCTCQKSDRVFHNAPHHPFPQVKADFQRWKFKALKYYNNTPEEEAVRNSRVFYLGLLRNPIEHALSEFFHVHDMCARKAWRLLYNEKTYEQICTLDLDGFINSDNNPVLSRQIYFFAKKAATDWRTQLFGAEHVQDAKETLEKMSMIFITEKLEEGLKVFSQYFHLPSPKYRRDRDTIKSKNIHKIIPARAAAYANNTVMEILREKMKDEIEVYEYAVKLYEKAKKFVENEMV